MTETRPLLFEPLQLRGLTLPNRIVVSPMCQYAAVDGRAQDWHLMHVGNLAVSGTGLLIMEMTNVEPIGRITPGCMGLWDDATETALKRVVDFCKGHSPTPMAVQLAHAGRKGSTTPPWAGRQPIPESGGGWRAVAPSAVPIMEGLPTPRALSRGEIQAIVEKFADSTRRAERIGYDAIELHGAHGYLLHQFLSPLSNRREDDYGGSLENRMRLTLEVFDAVRGEWPDDKPLGIRLSATDWMDGGWDIEQTVTLCKALAARGCDWIDVSSSGLAPQAQVPIGPGYQVPFAERIKQETGITTMSVGMITEPQQAEDILQAGQADLIAMARGLLYDPRWAWHAAEQLAPDTGGLVAYPDQYLRCRPWVRNDVFGEKGSGMR
ncbi:MAG: NADH:flavin oxidoreductase/NADH oxidase [Gammaproteobacteria bacterium]